MAGRRNWDWDETVLALALYMRVPLGSITSHNEEVVKLAALLGRTPGSVSMKMGNLARFDEKLRARNITGLTNGSKMDERVWRALAGDLSELARAEQAALEKFGQTKKPVSEPTLRDSFFRHMVLGQYHHACCMTGMRAPEFLTVKRLKKKGSVEELMDPANGICINMLYGHAFDLGLLTIDTRYRIVLSEALSHRPNPDATTRDWLLAAQGREILLPERGFPAREYIEYHNDTVFRHA